ncbi:palmitoyl-acyl carrier protein thioesterase, chloroplastic [Vigna angularis]|uniref:palmitoyl-acyl carrier protein thioesterase, chloroplastic n=1 Tax=Phaseolus angularis TaxID=3914 RepID=UPI00080A66FA|nr:palmitoyl-acyl carrier protein thioesterase, chloroplastic [Vigna angularis]
MNSAMTSSMVAPINMGKQLLGNWYNTNRRFSLCSHCTPVGLNTRNGLKDVPLINGTTRRKLGNESTEDFATFLRGSFVEGRFVYRQNFFVRSYETGPDKTISMETLTNFLQESALNHVSSCGFSQNSFGTSYEMDLRKLIWVVTRIQVQVQRYSRWGDEIEVETWIDVGGKNGTRRDWIIRDRYTKEIIAKATSMWAIMNRETRRLSKMPEEVRQELDPFYFNKFAIATEEIDQQKIQKLTDATAEGFRFGVTPGWNDMDVNQHVNNAKYTRWISESVPRKMLEDYKMTSMILEFRRECTHSDILESMTSASAKVIGASNNKYVSRKPNLQFIHLLRLQDNKTELVRARTEWNLKQNHT